MANVNIVLERDVKGTSYEKYTIYVNNKKHITGWIKPWLVGQKYHLYYHYMTATEMLETIQKMYYWLF